MWTRRSSSYPLEKSAIDFVIRFGERLGPCLVDSNGSELRGAWMVAVALGFPDVSITLHISKQDGGGARRVMKLASMSDEPVLALMRR